MRFAERWDEMLFEQIAACRSDKPLITTYPPPYEPPSDLRGKLPTFLSAHRFDDRGYLEQRSMIYPRQVKPLPSALLSANFLFGSSCWFREVPYDPHLYFHGEEITLAVRLWTHGWDLYGPSEPIVWHRYGREGRPTHWGDDPEWWQLDQRSLARMRRLLGMDDPIETSACSAARVNIGQYDLAEVRTLDAYQAKFGIHFVNRTISPDAQIGKFPV
jgi:hypothetical protein